MKILMNLVLIRRGDQVLLGMKKRRLGVGWWNGFGGKVLEGESMEDATKREVLEEVGIIVNQLEPRGILNFTFDENDSELEVHIFECRDFSGEAVESEEMSPKWFDISKMPYDQMWADDKYWMPLFFEGKQIFGNFHFDKDKQVKTYKINN